MVLKSKVSKEKETTETAADTTKVDETTETAADTTKVDETTETAADTTTDESKEVAVKEEAGAVSVDVLKVSAFCQHPAVLEAVADAKYGTFPSIVASNANHKVSGKKGKEGMLGPIIKFQAILAKDVWKVVPGSTDAEAKEYFKVSLDGETTTDGEDIQDALIAAREAGFDKADIKEYIDVICHVLECDNPDYVGETVTLQLAPSSQYTWKPLAGKCKMQAVLGTLKAEPFAGNDDLGKVVVITSEAVDAEWENNSYTKFEFSL